MKDVVAAIIKELEDIQLKKVVETLITENEKSFYESPAACGVHHAFPGGLAVHLTNTARTALTIYKRYDKYLLDQHGTKPNRDLVIAGAFLHDIGKVKCYQVGGTMDGKTTYHSTDESVLFHHIPIGFHMLASAIEKLCPDAPWKNNLLHIIISHHGRVEWSSPRPPKTIEAFIVHQADYLDAHIDQWGKNPVRTEFRGDRDGRTN